MIISQHETKPSACPHCAHAVDGATALDGAEAPAPGDLTLCWYCGKWSAFGDDGQLGKLDVEQTIRVMTRPECIAVTKWWHAKR